MTQREKFLSTVVGLLVFSLVAIWAINSIAASFEQRHDQIATLQQEIRDQQSKIRRGKAARDQLKDWENHSLSSDISRGQSQYWVWLHELSSQAGVLVDVKPQAHRAQGDLYVTHSFQVTGQADFRKLIQFLHHFYETGYLHRISTMAVTPQAGKRELEFSVTVEAIALNQAPVESDRKTPMTDVPLALTLEGYSAAILGRNFFAPPNSPPRLVSAAPVEGHPGKSVSYTIKASDPDKFDRLTYSLESSPVEGMTIDPLTGELKWTPRDLGTTEVAVRVTDDGYPAQSAVGQVKIAVVDPPPPKKENPFLKDDPARDAKVTAMVGAADKMQVWVTVPRGLGDQPRTLHLNVGDRISVGSFVGVVKDVRPREAEFSLDDGRSVVVRLEEPLAAPSGQAGL